MAETHHKPNHDYHLVDPSPWPILTTIWAMLLALWLVAVMKTNRAIDNFLTLESGGEVTRDAIVGDLLWGIQASPLTILIPLIALVVTVGFWWADVVKEAQVDKAHKPIVQLGLRYGMLLFILSEVCFFAAFFWAYFHASFTTDMLNGIKTFDVRTITSVRINHFE